MSEAGSLTASALDTVFRSACPGDPRPGVVAEAATPRWIRSAEASVPADVDELAIVLTEGGGWWVGCCPAAGCRWYPANADVDALTAEALTHAAVDHPERPARVRTIPAGGRDTAGL